MRRSKSFDALSFHVTSIVGSNEGLTERGRSRSWHEEEAKEEEEVRRSICSKRMTNTMLIQMAKMMEEDKNEVEEPEAVYPKYNVKENAPADWISKEGNGNVRRYYSGNITQMCRLRGESNVKPPGITWGGWPPSSQVPHTGTSPPSSQVPHTGDIIVATSRRCTVS